MASKKLSIAALILFGLLVVIQIVPYGRDHSNPAVTGSPDWDSPRTEQLARRACFDCHSNETRWPWYASIAPVSWRVQGHVDEARSKLNFSEFDRSQRHARRAAEELRDGDMPPWDYALMHADSRLGPEEKQALIDGFVATFGGDGEKDD